MGFLSNRVERSDIKAGDHIYTYRVVFAYSHHVVQSCLDCFLRDGALYGFEYGVNPTIFFAKVRGGTCTTATSDDPDIVIHQAMYPLQTGFGNYDVVMVWCGGGG
ncbi:putative LRAT domain-containing protein [Helianthus annuus]|nr:putative LRAT domain-containing protein [Helianthus annuus]